MVEDIRLLISLLEDPDPEVYRSVSQQIIAIGDSSIPMLEKASSLALSHDHFDRINQLLSELKFQRIKNRLKKWIEEDKDILTGISLVTELLDPDNSSANIINTFTDIKNEIWLELSGRLTALEKIRVINHFFYTKNNFQIEEPVEVNPRNFSLSRLLTDRKGTEESIYAAYVIIVRMLDLPVYGVEIPGISLLAYLDLPFSPKKGFDPGRAQAMFFISPVEKGKVFGVKEVQHFIKGLYPDFVHYEINAIPDLHLVERFTSQLAAACRKSGKTDLENKVRELLTLWGKP